MRDDRIICCGNQVRVASKKSQYVNTSETLTILREPLGGTRTALGTLACVATHPYRSTGSQPWHQLLNVAVSKEAFQMQPASSCAGSPAGLP